MQRGSKPKPAHLRLVGGNAGKRPINESEPVPKGKVVKPKRLEGLVSEIWDEIAPALIEDEVLTAWDVRSFVRWCWLEAKFQETPNHVSTAEMAETRKIGEQFGLSGQSSRARLKGNGKKDSDPTAKFF